MKKCETCGDEQDYNFALNIGLCNGCIGEKLEQLQAELDKHRWIPVSERLPKKSKTGHPQQTEYVYLYTGKKSMIEAFYDYYYKEWYNSDGTSVQGTHWKPIILPKGEQE